MYSRNRRYRSSPHSLHLSSDNINTSGKHVDTPPRDIYLDLVTSSRLLDERLSRRFSDRHYHGDGSAAESRNDRDSDSRGDGVSEWGTRNASSFEPPRVSTDSYIPYGARSRPPERGKWLAYAKNIKPRKQRGSNLTKSQSMDNIDICSKYPRLQNSNFYQNLHKKYPQAFQRRLSAEAKTRRPSRRLFNSGLHVQFQDDVYDSEDTRSVCSERPMSGLERDLSDFLSYGNHQYDRDCKTSPTPSMMSDRTVKERLNATSDRLYHLLYNGVPQSHYRNSYDPGLTPRSEVTPRARRSRTSSVSSDLHGFDDLDHLSSPRHLDPYHSILNASRLAQEEQIQSLQRELELKDRQLRTYRQKLDLDTQSMHSSGSKHSEDLDSSYTRVISPDSPPDSAIDVDSSSIQSVISMDTRYHHNTDNSSTDVKYPNGSDALEKNGDLPNTDANYFMNDLDSFTLTDVILEVDEEHLDIDTGGTVTSNKEDLGVTDEIENGGGVTDRVSPIPTSSSPESESEAMMQAIVQQTMSRIPSSSSVKDHSLPVNDHSLPVNDHSLPVNDPSSSVNDHSLPVNDHSLPVNDHSLPVNDHSSSVNDHSLPENDFHSTPGNDLQNLSSELSMETPVNIMHNSSDDSPRRDLQHSHCHDSTNRDAQNQTCSHVHFDEEEDDSDPRLGMPEVKTYNETLIQERYHEKRQKFKYHAKRHCMTPPDSAPLYRKKCQSDDQVSVLCSPRPPSSSGISRNKIQKSGMHQSNQSLNVVPEKQDLGSRRLVSESDIRNVGLENPGIFFSKSSNTGSVWSFQSDLSTDTLVASQQTLTDLTESYPKVTLHSHSPRKKFHFKNIFKGKKGHYNPSQVEANLPVDLETMLKRSSESDSSLNQEANETFYSVQYEKSKNHSLHAEDVESGDRSDNESPQINNKHQGARDQNNVKEDDCHTAAHCSTVNSTSDCLPGQAVLGPPPAYSTHLEDSQLTAYEAALVNLDQNGVDIDELIESDLDSVFSAKPVVIDLRQKNQNKTQEISEGRRGEEGEIGTGEIGIGEIGIGETGKGETGTGETGTGMTGTGETGTGETGTGVTGIGETGIGETGTGEGTQEVEPLEVGGDHTQVKQQSAVGEEKQDDSIDSEDEVFTHDDMETTNQTLPVMVDPGNLGLSREELEPTLATQPDVNGTKEKTVQSKIISNSPVDNTSDTDEDNTSDTDEDSEADTVSDGDSGKVDIVSGVSSNVDVSRDVEYNTGASTRHNKQGNSDNWVPIPGNQGQGDQGPDQKDHGPEHEDQGSEPEELEPEQGGQGRDQKDQGSEQGDQGSEPEDQGSEPEELEQEQGGQGPEQGGQGPKHENQGPEQGVNTQDMDPAPVEVPYATVIVHGDSSVSPGTQDNSDSNNCAELDLCIKTLETENTKARGDNQIKQFSFVAAGSHVDDSITVLDESTPPVPKRAYQREESNLVRSKELSASKQSLSDKVRSSAKSKFKAIRKAVSLDKGLNKAGEDNSDDIKKDKNKEKKKSGFKMPKIKAALFTRKKKSKPPMAPVSTAGKESVDTKTPPEKAKNDQGQKQQGQRGGYVGKVSSCQSLESLDSTPDAGLVESNGPLGKLLKLNQDGTQVIQIHKPKHGPVGFFIARGNAQFNHGVFVSRFSEGPQEAMYSGLLSVGDEILEINKFVLRDLALDDIYDIMAAKETLVMTILPLMARKDV
ncbi:uncharacterized protein LOC110458247 isoform X2 [Mizuhopecten yessoensis]|uniref:uncharacterized protein LOC110458247 isoform X2 n=1 Tax=Mizuhopecten yessoensis TaxID=6573 RepID=UPI000B45E667|nr:uncharacterized protein LOC110458247 isoform X2 [Mizuhopecten yessoensis]